MVRTKKYFFLTPEDVNYYSKFRLDKKSIETVYRDLVDSVLFSESANLDIAGDVGIGSIDLLTEVLTIEGTVNEILTNVVGQIVTIELPNSITISGTYTGGGLIVSGSTALTSVSTGLADNDKIVTQGYVDDKALVPALHHTTHEIGGTDEINIDGGSF